MSVISQEKVNNETTAARYRAVGDFSEQLRQPLSAEDCMVQSMPDVSPTRWHLAHTTWFFETFVLADDEAYEVFDDSYGYLFNSYYNTVGKQFPRSQRGLISRPGVAEILAYRRHVDDAMLQRLESNGALSPRLVRVIEIGLQHEQQHQELMLTDIKHVLSCNPLSPVYRPGSFPADDSLDEPRERAAAFPPSAAGEPAWQTVDAGLYEIGHEGDEFAFDNEAPRHRVYLDPFRICVQLVTCGDFLRFIADDGYRRPEFWLSLGWQAVSEQAWDAPLYWYQEGGQWFQFTLAGPRQVDPNLPVCHVSYFEADAFARWSGARLPTEAEWEVAAGETQVDGNFADTALTAGAALHPGSTARSRATTPSRFGDVWQWTASPYTPYPGYTAPSGALGEYNGKFMCNQYVLRGGSCASSSTHIRPTYRNFFPPEARWQFSGLRLCQPT